MASGRLIQRRCSSAQDPPTISIPVEMIDQGWHHQGFSDQNGGCSGGLAEGIEFTSGLHGGEIVVATNH